MPHLCHAAGCTQPVYVSYLMCSRHWFMVPGRIKKLVWKYYREGQERDKIVTHAYCEAARAAVTEVALKEHRTEEEIAKACRVYDMLDPGPTDTLF